MRHIIVDMMFDVHRAFHAHKYLSTTDGRKSGVVYGVLRALSFYKKSIGGKIYVIWDGCPVHRKEIDPMYKEGRAEWGHDMLAQASNLKKLFSYLGITQLENKEWEADDVIFSKVESLVDNGSDENEIVVVTGDDDLLQLVDDFNNVKVFNPRYKIWYNEFEVIKKYGVKPSQLRLLWALGGDSSDGIVGVKGLGEAYTKAFALKFGSIENFIDELEHGAFHPVTKKDMRVYAGKDLIKKNFGLLQLQSISITEIPVEKNEQLAKDVMYNFELNSMIEDMQPWMNLGE